MYLPTSSMNNPTPTPEHNADRVRIQPFAQTSGRIDPMINSRPPHTAWAM
jgi:hypothetical protein